MKATVKRYLNAREGLEDADKWMRYLGRVGLAAVGIVYVAVGVLALRVAFGVGGDIEGAQGALAEIGEKPFGKTLLYIIGLGLIAFAIYRILAAIKDIDARGSDGEGILKRSSSAFTGLIYGALGFSVLRLPGGGGGGGDGEKQQAATAELMSQPYGRWLVGLVGLIVIGVAIYRAYRAWQYTFMKKFKTQQMSPKEVERVSKAGKWGIVARSAVLVVTGWFLVQAALQYDSSESGGLAKALASIASQSYGTILLALVAIGLLLYAVYSFYLARYRAFSKGRA